MQRVEFHGVRGQESVLHPHNAVVRARDVEITDGVLRARRGDVTLSGFSQPVRRIQVLPDGTVVADGTAEYSALWQDMAIFIRNGEWRLVRSSGEATLTAITGSSKPEVLNVQVSNASVFLGGQGKWNVDSGAGGTNVVPGNGIFSQGLPGWTVTKGTVVYNVRGDAAWFIGHDGNNIAEIETTNFITVDIAKSYTLSFDYICEPYGYQWGSPPPAKFLSVYIDQYDSSDNFISTVLTATVPESMLHDQTGMGNWHRHFFYGGVVLASQWSPSCAKIKIRVRTNNYKRRITNIRFEYGQSISYLQEPDGDVLQVQYMPPTEAALNHIACTLDAQDWRTYGAVLCQEIFIEGAALTGDAGIYFLLENADGVVNYCPLVSWSQRAVTNGASSGETDVQSVRLQDALFDVTNAPRNAVVKVGIAWVMAPFSGQGSASPRVARVKGAATDSDDWEFALRAHYRVPKGTHVYIVTERVKPFADADYAYESEPSEAYAYTVNSEYTGLRIRAKSRSGRPGAVLRCYRAVEGRYLLVGEAQVDANGEAVFTDMGETEPELWLGGRGDLPTGSAVTWQGRLAVADNTGWLWVSAHASPLVFASYPVEDDVSPFLVVLSAPPVAVDEEGGRIVVYTRYGAEVVVGTYPDIVVTRESRDVPVHHQAAKSGVVVAADGIFFNGERVFWGQFGSSTPAAVCVAGASLAVGAGSILWVYGQRYSVDGWVEYTMPGDVRDVVYDGAYFVVATASPTAPVVRVAADTLRVGNGAWKTGALPLSPLMRVKWGYVYGAGSVNVMSPYGQQTLAVSGQTRFEMPVPGGILPRALQWELQLNSTSEVHAFGYDLIDTPERVK